MSAVSRMRLPRLSIRRPAPPRPRTIIAIALVLALLGGGWLWLRGSSLVSVDRVTVMGLSGPTSDEIHSALSSAARNMTTLDVNMSALRMAVAPFPIVKSLSVTTQFPHGMRIRVIEQVPVGAVTVDGRAIPVAADGTLLPSLNASGLSSIPLSVPPGGARLTDRVALAAVAVLAAAPAWLRTRVMQVSSTSANGLVAKMRDGPAIYFGSTSHLRAKWMAAAAVLADPSSEGAAYIDVTVPARPAVGGVAGAASADQSILPGGATNPAAATTSGAGAVIGAGYTTATAPSVTAAATGAADTTAPTDAATGSPVTTTPSGDGAPGD